MAVPKKRTSMSKKRIRRNIWRKKGYLTLVKVSSLTKSFSVGNSKSFIKEKPNKRVFGFCGYIPLKSLDKKKMYKFRLRSFT